MKTFTTHYTKVFTGPKMTKLYLLPALLLFCLSACDSGPSFAQLCEENPEICSEFHEDSWCKKERILVGAANIAYKKSPVDIHIYDQLIAYENYEKCVSHAAKIEHIKLKEKKTRRIDNMMKARGRLTELAELSENSEHPRLLYFHWTRYLNEESLNKFLALEGSAELETPESQFDLATYYAKRDQKKTLQLLFHSLELHKEGELINDEVFKTLSSIFADKGEFKQAYIWLKILTLYDPIDEDFNDSTLSYFIKQHDLDGEFLDKVANSTLSHIISGSFTPPQF